jgi:DNA polymerase-1
MKQILSEELNIVLGLPFIAVRGDKIAIDTEFSQMDVKRLHRAHGLFSGMGFTFDGKTVYIITDEKLIPQAMKNIDAGTHIYHNSKFDVGQIRRYCSYPDRKLIWDTMILEQIMFAGWYSAGEFSLADLSRRYLDCYMDKSVREQFETSDGEMTQEQIEYLAVDIVTTWRVYQEQRKLADENDLNIWKNVDRGAMYSVLKMNGMKLNVDAWMELYKFNLSESERIQAKYGKEELVGKKHTWTGINLNSPAQVKKELSSLGYYRLESTDEKSLAVIVNECEFAKDVLEYRGYAKAAKTYGANFVEEHVEKDGRIYSDFYVNGAATGRFSSSKPNVENIPVRDGNQFRECFVAQDDYVLVDADFSTQEPRVWSYLADDKLMQDIFRKKKDIYIASAKLMFDWELTKEDPRRQTRMKPTVLGAIFGLTEHGLLRKDQIPLDEGKELLDAFWDAYPASTNYRDDIKKTKDYVQTIYGRKYWLNIYQWGYENNCLNSPVQGSAADITKISGYKFQQEVEKAGYSDRVWLINYIHDELLVECHRSLLEWTTAILERVMVESAEQCHEGVPAKVGVKFGQNWAIAHG